MTDVVPGLDLPKASDAASETGLHAGIVIATTAISQADKPRLIGNPPLISLHRVEALQGASAAKLAKAVRYRRRPGRWHRQNIALRTPTAGHA